MVSNFKHDTISLMPTDQIVPLLIAERDRLNAAISVLQGGTAVKRRGRPPKSASVDGHDGPFPMVRRKPTFSKAQRLAASKRMKARWAAKKKAAAKKA